MSHKVVVVGAGIAGLGAAYALQQAGCHVTVLEQSARVGGRMQTDSHQGFTWDTGAQFMLKTYYHMQQLMGELGLRMASEPIPSVQAIALPDGRLRYGDTTSPMAFLGHPQIPWREKLRAYKLFVTAWRHPSIRNYHAPELTAAIDTESLRTWGDREIGREAVDLFLSLPTSTLFFWTAEETPWWFPAAFLAMAAEYRVVVPEGGMGVVPQALARRLQVQVKTAVQRVEPTRTGGAVVRTNHGDMEADRVVIATPAPIALALLEHPEALIGKGRTDYLASARYVRNTTTAAAYAQAPERKAYGVGFPLSLGGPLAAIGWDHLKGSDRAPAGAGIGVLMPTHTQSQALWARSDEEVGAELVGAVERYYPGSRSGALFHQVRRWPFAIPVMHPGRYRALASVLGAGPLPGSPVFLCGDYLMGACTEQALATGWRAAREVLLSLGSAVPPSLAAV